MRAWAAALALAFVSAAGLTACVWSISWAGTADRYGHSGWDEVAEVWSFAGILLSMAGLLGAGVLGAWLASRRAGEVIERWRRT